MDLGFHVEYRDCIKAPTKVLMLDPGPLSLPEILTVAHVSQGVGLLGFGGCNCAFLGHNQLCNKSRIHAAVHIKGCRAISKMDMGHNMRIILRPLPKSLCRATQAAKQLISARGAGSLLPPSILCLPQGFRCLR